MSETFKTGTYRCPKCNEPFYRDEPWKVTCLPCYLWTKKRTATPPPVRTVVVHKPIELGMLRRLLQLCHPDRHGNSEASNTATRFLLALKEATHG